MTNRILPVTLTTMIMLLSVGCGGAEDGIKHEQVFMCPNTSGDYDQDGVMGNTTAYGEGIEEKIRQHSCAFPDDWCPSFPGPATNHGCPTVTLGETCNTVGILSSTMLAQVDFDLKAQIYPTEAFCMFSPQDVFRVFPGRSENLGTWVAPNFDLILFANGYVPKYLYGAPATIKWTTKDGRSGEVLQKSIQDPVYYDLTRMLLPTDGSLATLEVDDPAGVLTLFTLGRKEIRCTEKNAQGGHICRF